MNQANTLLTGLMAGLLAGIAHSETAATEPTHAAPEFKIMSDAEVQQHRERMAKLSEAAREAYRSAEYEKLKDRAEQEGYRLPDEPPWTEASSADNNEAGIQLTAAGTGEAPPPGLGPSEAYRATMKQRFERYLEERAERRADAAATRPPGGPPVPVDGHLAEQRESAAGQHAEQQTRMEERKAEMEARREGYRAEMQERNAQAEARAEERQEGLLKLRSNAAKPTSDTDPETRSTQANVGEDPRDRRVPEQLKRLREANAAERQELRDQADQRIARQKAELEALRYRQGDRAAKPVDPPAKQATAPGTPLEAPDSVPTKQAAGTAEIEPAAAATAGDPGGGVPAATDKDKIGTSAARPPAPARGYYRQPPYPRYPAIPYPAYPYYPNPYWAPPR